MNEHRPRTNIANRAVDRRAASVLAIVISLVIVALATIAVASTFVAIRATEARKKAADDLEQAKQALNASVVAAATREDLKGFKMGAAREELIKPALKFYESYIAAHETDQPPSPQVAEAYLRIAGLQAKLGSMKSVDALNKGVTYIDELVKADVDPETYPSIEECAMKVAAPNEWLLLKGASFDALPKHGARLFIAIQGAIRTFKDARNKFPDAVKPRDELAGVMRYSALFQVRQREYDRGLRQWSQARDVLETLVRDQPANTGYQRRLAEALVAVGQLQKRLNDVEAARKSYERAVEIGEKLATGSPDDKELAAELETAKKELSALPPAAEVAASPESAATPDAPNKEPDAADADATPTGDGEAAAAKDPKRAASDDANQADAAPAPKDEDTAPPSDAKEAASDDAAPEKPDAAPATEEPAATP